MRDPDSALLANRRSVMSLYSDPTDPASHAVRFVLAEKAINVEIHQVTMENKPEDLNDLNPYSAILTLVDRDLVLYEPSDHHGVPRRTFSASAADAGRSGGAGQQPAVPVSSSARLLCTRRRCGEPGQGVSNPARKCLRDHLSTLAPIFAQKMFFMSDDYSLVDCYLAPILWRLPAYGVRLPAHAKSLQRFADRIFEREAFAQSLTEAEHELRSG